MALGHFVGTGVVRATSCAPESAAAYMTRSIQEILAALVA